MRSSGSYKSLSQYKTIETHAPNLHHKHEISIVEKAMPKHNPAPDMPVPPKYNHSWCLKKSHDNDDPLLEKIAQDLFRLLIPNHPKTYLVLDDKKMDASEPDILSKYIPDFTSLEQISASKIQTCLESGAYWGLGEVLFLSLVLTDNDVKPGNLGVTSKGQIIKIDGGCCFSKLNDPHFCITEAEIRGLPFPANYAPYNWLDIIQEKHRQSSSRILKIDFCEHDGIRIEIHRAMMKFITLSEAFIQQFITDAYQSHQYSDDTTLLSFLQRIRQQVFQLAKENHDFLAYLNSKQAASDLEIYLNHLKTLDKTKSKSGFLSCHPNFERDTRFLFGLLKESTPPYQILLNDTHHSANSRSPLACLKNQLFLSQIKDEVEYMQPSRLSKLLLAQIATLNLDLSNLDNRNELESVINIAYNHRATIFTRLYELIHERLFQQTTALQPLGLYRQLSIHLNSFANASSFIEASIHAENIERFMRQHASLFLNRSKAHFHIPYPGKKKVGKEYSICSTIGTRIVWSNFFDRGNIIKRENEFATWATNDRSGNITKILFRLSCFRILHINYYNRLDLPWAHYHINNGLFLVHDESLTLILKSSWIRPSINLGVYGILLQDYFNFRITISSLNTHSFKDHPFIMTHLHALALADFAPNAASYLVMHFKELLRLNNSVNIEFIKQFFSATFFKESLFPIREYYLCTPECLTFRASLIIHPQTLEDHNQMGYRDESAMQMPYLNVLLTLTDRQASLLFTNGKQGMYHFISKWFIIDSAWLSNKLFGDSSSAKPPVSDTLHSYKASDFTFFSKPLPAAIPFIAAASPSLQQ